MQKVLVENRLLGYTLGMTNNALTKTPENEILVRETLAWAERKVKMILDQMAKNPRAYGGLADAKKAVAEAKAWLES